MYCTLSLDPEFVLVGAQNSIIQTVDEVGLLWIERTR